MVIIKEKGIILFSISSSPHPYTFFCKFTFGKICSMMDRMKIIFHKELKTKNAETNKLFSQLSALLVLVMGNIKKELKKTAHRRLWIVLTK